MVTNMSHLFSGMLGFNEPLDGWDTSSVTDALTNAVVFHLEDFASFWQFLGSVVFFPASPRPATKKLAAPKLEAFKLEACFGLQDMSGMFQDAQIFNQALGLRIPVWFAGWMQDHGSTLCDRSEC